MCPQQCVLVCQGLYSTPSKNHPTLCRFLLLYFLLIFKLPYNMRERWRRVVDDIMELQGRPVKFDDLVSFIDLEARIATNPVFGEITESSKILEAS